MSSFTPGCGCIRLRKALEIFRWEWAEGQVVGGIVNKPDKQVEFAKMLKILRGPLGNDP
jgi:hypothetical protein